jgi:hypothetical protein
LSAFTVAAVFVEGEHACEYGVVYDIYGRDKELRGVNNKGVGDDGGGVGAAFAVGEFAVDLRDFIVKGRLKGDSLERKKLDDDA